MSWLVDTALYTGVLIALVLVLRRPVARLFGPGMAYALWALPLLRLVLPPLVLPGEQAPVQVILADADAVAPAVAVASASDPLPLGTVFFAVWLAGAIAFLAWRAWTYREMRRQLLAEARPVGEAGTVRLVETPATSAPVAFGIGDKVVALPPGFMAREDLAGRDLAIAHELEHHAGRDLAVNIAMQPLLALHWCNPLAWLGWRALRRDQEAACDARVLAGASRETREAYGRLIASFAHSPRLALAAPMACPMLGEKSIVHRLRSLTMTEPTPRKRLLGRALIGAAVLALPLTASITYAASDEPPAAPETPTASDAPKVKVTRKVVIVEHEGGATPDDSKLVTKVIERDGKTIVLKTGKPLSEAEVEERVAKALAAFPEIPEVPMPPEAGDGKHVRSFVLVRDGEAPKDGERHERKVIVIGGGQGQAGALAMAGAEGAVVCTESAQGNDISAETRKDGERQVVRMRFCNKGGSQAMAVDAMRKARDRLAEDKQLSDEIRAKVIEELNREIERLSKAG
jgi:beta-lactamase regulating signal transducer with metallopeptidase domain